jgi:hypothetical protein
LKKVVKKLLGSLGFGILVTIFPFLLSGLFWADSFKRIVAFIDWPMLAIQSHFGRLLPQNAGERAITFLLINIASWTLIAYLASASFSASRRMITSRRLRGN